MKVFKYIFKQKLLIAVAIALLLMESLCTFITPYISSVAIDYGIQQGGIVYGTPLDLDAYSYRASRFIVSDEDKILIEKSYDVVHTDRQFFEGDIDNIYYAINIYGLSHISKLEKAFVPVMSFLYDYPEKMSFFDHLGKPFQDDITVADITAFKNEIGDYAKSHDVTTMYKNAVKAKVNENTYLGVDTE